MDLVFATHTERVGETVVPGGSHWPADDPLVRSRPELFSPDPRFGLAYTVEPAGYNDPPVEQATAAPGERRNVRRT